MSTMRFLGFLSDRRFLETANRMQWWIEEESVSILVPFKYGYYNDKFTSSSLTQDEIFVPAIGRSKDFSRTKT